MGIVIGWVEPLAMTSMVKRSNVAMNELLRRQETHFADIALLRGPACGRRAPCQQCRLLRCQSGHKDVSQIVGSDCLDTIKVLFKYN